MKKVGIIGLGVVGQRLIKEFRANPHTEIDAVCDVNKTLAAETADACGGVTALTDFEELVQRESIDIVYVAVPPAYHHAVVLAAIANGKHVLCEKPLANSLQEAEEMLAKAEQANVVHAIHFPLPYNAPFTTIKERVEKEELGDVRRISLKLHFDVWPRVWQQTPWIGTREQGGFIREILPHYLQMIVHMFGKVTKVDAQIEFPEDQEKSEIGLIARLTLENGLQVLVDGLVGQAEKEKIAFTIHGTNQTIALEDWRIVKQAQRGEELTIVEPSDLTPSPVDLIDEFVKAAEGEEAFLIDFKEGLLVQEVLESLLTSNKTAEK
ncbi:Gfo/Idh/MocA family protein [Alkalihalobacterium chitinilyticum]|uniref:Gfo/Idh/MocA family oxidoreductase n=1 Tax=Alkalihalobacterium chitinilyticum TaxID=2980103 RepID=A0ABT5VJF2_9BACI|nr:Gfo/Idh/MocA family oxidoreductase [Alkalihalobacterium chitinilyticum]MDE5415581.1 Gfo/Idh/MocA family oxidoreductase [Alkalihalobacterium chitinilyticum]